jgi:predicted AlkP superfamily pyrophosphatase or phosphodiesterase
MARVCVLNVVGLTPSMVGPETPNLAKLGPALPLGGVIPAVTCPAQATMLTGLPPARHGVVGNGWFDRDLGEVLFWRQSNRLVQGEKLYEAARRLGKTTAKLFWWFNRGAAVEASVTPLPHYGSDGSKRFAIDGTPSGLSQELERRLGAFPFAAFWGPRAGIESTAWIARAAVETLRLHKPDLLLAYLPHLDYDLQRFGPGSPEAAKAVRDVDREAGLVIDAARHDGMQVIVVSEYGLAPVSRPVHINRFLRERGLLVVRDGPFGEMLDPFKSAAFAVADHQVAHVYVRPGAGAEVRDRLEGVEGVERVLDGGGQAEWGLAHPRAGDLVLLARPDAWFTYYYWVDDRRAPDFARTVDIHRKPGYDPCELFVDPGLTLPALRVARRLAQKKLGFRYRMDVVPLDASLVRGSHGLAPASLADGPVALSSVPLPPGLSMAGIKAHVLEQLSQA